MRRAILVAVALSFFVVGKTVAGYRDGNELLSDCEGQARGAEDSQWGICLGYILGAYDALESTTCVPDVVKASQLRDVVKIYLRNHPEERHHQASSLVVAALKQAFPCN